MSAKHGERRAICGICPAGCWVIVAYDEKGRLAAVRADESSPFGTICNLGRHAPEIVYSKDRLLYPLRRKGPKGTYEFERISWKEALDEVTGRLEKTRQEYGPEAACVYTGRGSFELAMCDVFQPQGVAVSSASSLLFPFGSPNTMGVGALCYVSMAMIAPHVTMGGMFINMFSDIENAELIVVWGGNPATDCPPLDYQRILEARRRGAQVVVIDPRRTMTARIEGARWIPIRPGTDGALALGMCRTLIEEDLCDESFIKEWTHGFEEFAGYAQHFHPEMVETVTGVPAAEVRSLARRLAEARGAAPVMYSGLEYSDSGVQAIRATMVLWALAGQLDVPGGRCFTMRQNHFPINREGLIANPKAEKAAGRDLFPVYGLYRGESHANALPDAVLRGKPYPIRSLIVLGGSIITSWPQPDVWRRTLGGLDFLVCVDVNLTADCAYADLVLPAATWFEIESYMTYGPMFRIRERVIEPPGEARNAFFIFAEMAGCLGYGHLYPQNEEELLHYVLRGSPFTLEDVRAAGGCVQVPAALMEYKKWEKGLLRPDGRPGFDTPTGKLEIASTILEEHGYDALPVYTEPAEGPLSQPELARDFPLVFNSGARVTTDFRSQFHGIPSLAKQRPEPTVMLHTRDARARGIEHGDAVHVSSPRGRVRMRASVTDDIVPGVVEANMGGGGPLGPKAWQDCNINDLTALRYDPISGFPIYKALLCEVTRAPQEGESVSINSGETFDAPARSTPQPAPAQRIYLDHNATTPLAPEVQSVMTGILEGHFGNPSSLYREGREARSAIEEARRKIAGFLGCSARRVCFTGGGSEANNLAVKGAALAALGKKDHIVTSSVEHPSVLRVCSWIEKLGFRITHLPVDNKGLVNPRDLERTLTDSTCLVTVMAANNETGMLQPIKELAAMARRRGALFHTDAVQAAGKTPLDVEELGVDLLTLSGHKFHGPKGTGVLYIRKNTLLDPLVHGGGQEMGLRGGTENTAGIVGLGSAAELAGRRLGEFNSRIRTLRDELWEGILRIFPGTVLIGDRDRSLPNTLSVSLPGIRGESLVLAMDQHGVSFSSGSACRSGSPKPSHAFLAMGLSEEEAHCTVRFSLGLDNTREQIARVVDLLEHVTRDSISLLRFVPCR